MIQLGIEVLLTSCRDLLKGKRVGLVSNYNVTDSHFRPVIDLLVESDDWQVMKLFGPEHGVKNSAKEGEHVSSGTDDHTGLPVFSLYGETRKPSADMLTGLDILVIDLQDIGCRYYTNMNTMAYCMEACAEIGLPCLVLDRPNPINGTDREGTILDLEYRSFVGMHAIPNRHGLTMGELANYFNQHMEPRCDLTVIEVHGWKRETILSETGLPFIPSSPNTDSLEMCLLYPGTCLFEGTNVSLGRGTANPFKVLGAPYVNGHLLADWFNQKKLPGVIARPLYFTPTYSQYAGELCSGIQLHVTNPKRLKSVLTGVTLLQGMADLFSNHFNFLQTAEGQRPFIDLLAGTNKLREFLGKGQAITYITDSEFELDAFSKRIKPFEIY